MSGCPRGPLLEGRTGRDRHLPPDLNSALEIWATSSTFQAYIRPMLASGWGGGGGKKKSNSAPRVGYCPRICAVLPSPVCVMVAMAPGPVAFRLTTEAAATFGWAAGFGRLLPDSAIHARTLLPGASNMTSRALLRPPPDLHQPMTAFRHGIQRNAMRPTRGQVDGK